MVMLLYADVTLMLMLLYADASCPPLANSNACEPRYLAKFGLGKILTTMRHSIPRPPRYR